MTTEADHQTPPPSSLKGLLGRKLGMTQVFVEQGRVMPVTVLEVGPCPVVQVKLPEKDGYAAVQLGYTATKEKRLSKSELGHLAKGKITPVKDLREIKVDKVEGIEPGQEFKVDLFSRGDKVSVTSYSKGKGFAGVIKRHGFSGGRASHGSMFHRAPGSIGASAYPSRVIKGKKLPGQMGNRRVTIKNLEVVRVIPEDNLLLVKGAVPGARGALVEVKLTQTGKKGKA